jgi:hypothetical protein
MAPDSVLAIRHAALGAPRRHHAGGIRALNSTARIADDPDGAARSARPSPARFFTENTARHWCPAPTGRLNDQPSAMPGGQRCICTCLHGRPTHRAASSPTRFVIVATFSVGMRL